ncbi:restriction endonuclease subunit S [Micromonospora sp. NPDC003197]
MDDWEAVRLGNLCEVATGGTPLRTRQEYFGGDIPWVKIGDMLQGHVVVTEESISEAGLRNSSAKMFPAGTVLISIFATIGRTAVLGVDAATNQAIAGLIPRDASVLSPSYLRRYLDSAVAALERKARGVAQVNINSSILKSLEVPLVPMMEQCRIVEALNRVDELRAKRRQALAHLDNLVHSIFTEMFGDPIRNPTMWPTVRLGEVLDMPLRNGLSPSNRGDLEAKVLTLSSVTGARFDSSACKSAKFSSAPPSSQSVDRRDFLVCRGNGNLKLVGRGFFPDRSMPDVTFPDTIIAARISTRKIRPSFLQHVWGSPAVRVQIESAARTTNGTYKVNQAMLENIYFHAPSLELQDRFTWQVNAIERLKEAHQAHLVELDGLFGSLQDRAFRGAL